MLSISLRERGFLPAENPLSKLPDEYYPVEELQRALPELFGTKHLRPYLETKVPPLTIDNKGLKQAEVVAITRNCLFACSAYVHNHNEPTADHIPENLARLTVGACDCLWMKPILSYQSYCLNNWRFLEKPIAGKENFDPDNLELIQKFVPDKCETWFVVIHTAIEKAAAAGLAALIETQQAVLQDHLNCACEKLEVVRDSLEKMIQILKRMPEHCKPEEYYHRVRPQIQKFEKVIYCGVERFQGQPQSFRGETGAQSSVIPAFIRFLGIRHKDSALTVHLNDMLHYMPQLHQLFLEETPRKTPEGLSIIRDYVINKLPKSYWDRNNEQLNKFWPRKQSSRLRAMYNDCIRLVQEFRTIHLGYALTYIKDQTGDEKGTGNTIYPPWLTQMRDEAGGFIL